MKQTPPVLTRRGLLVPGHFSHACAAPLLFRQTSARLSAPVRACVRLSANSGGRSKGAPPPVCACMRLSAMPAPESPPRAFPLFARVHVVFGFSICAFCIFCAGSVCMFARLSAGARAAAKTQRARSAEKCRQNTFRAHFRVAQGRAFVVLLSVNEKDRM